MKKSSLLVAILVLVSTSVLTLTSFPDIRATTLYVGGGGPGNYTTIQGAIDDAGIGDTVFVFTGTYYENVVINKTLSLIGENRETTTIDGGGVGDVIRVTANWVNVSGFSVTNSGPLPGPDVYDTGIELDSVQNSLIFNNNASGNQIGINLNSSEWNSVTGNIASSNSGSGIHLIYSLGNNITGNLATNNFCGIFLSHGTTWNNITGNNASSNSQRGIELYYADMNNVLRNNISSNFIGIISAGSYANHISGNTLSSQDNGVYLSYDSNHNTVSRNIISFNERGLRIFQSSFNRIYHNRFVDNRMYQADDFDTTDTNWWDDGYPSGGNYWSDYAGTDQFSGPNQNLPGDDGIGDTPYDVDLNSQDVYPLMATSMIPARPPIMMRAELTGQMYEDVTITWDLSPDDGVGANPVVGYIIHRNMTYDLTGLGYSSIASLPAGTSEFIDNLAGEGDPKDYFYQVCAVDQNNNASCAGVQAGKFTRPLSKGPNLISIPLVQSDEATEKVLQTVEFDKAWSFIAVENKWKWFMTFKPYKGDLRTVNNGMGIWVNVTAESNLTVAGVVPSNTQIQLYAGWNLVSFPSFDSDYLVSDLKSEIGAVRTEGIDLLASPYHLKVLSDADNLEAGYGYWISLQADATWIVRNS
jgi:parallel beta-helix repeat protein